MRRDRLGRRIGRNRWREHVTDLWRCADHAWFLEAEATALGYRTELEEYRAEHPRPTLKSFLLELAGTWRGQLEHGTHNLIAARGQLETTAGDGQPDTGGADSD